MRPSARSEFAEAVALVEKKACCPHDQMEAGACGSVCCAKTGSAKNAQARNKGTAYNEGPRGSLPMRVKAAQAADDGEILAPRCVGAGLQDEIGLQKRIAVDGTTHSNIALNCGVRWDVSHRAAPAED